MPKIERVAIEENDNSAIVYFSIEDEKFYLAVFLDTEPHVKVRFISAEGFYYVALMALSETLDYSKLCSLTVLNPVSGFNKGDERPFGKLLYKYSWLKFRPNPEPDNFENKIKNLLDYLEQDRQGLERLVENADVHIYASLTYHNGNTDLGEFFLDNDIIHRLSEMKLRIAFHVSAKGIFFKE